VTFLKRTAFCLGLIAFQLSAQELKQDGARSQDWAALRHTGYAAFQAGDYATAASDFEEALPLARTPEQRAATLTDIGFSLSELGRMKKALEKLRPALSMWREIDARGDGAAKAAMWTGNVQRSIGEFAEAERTLRTALDASPRERASHAALLNALASLLQEQGRSAEAREKFEAALRLSPAAGENRMYALIGLGDTERVTREWQPAIEHLNEAITVAKQMRDAGVEAAALRNLGNTYTQMGDLAKAEYLLRRAVAILEAMPVLQFQYEATLICVGILYQAEKKYGLAEDSYTRALSKKGGLDAADARSALPLQYLAILFAQQKRFREARDLANRARSIMTAAFGAESVPAAGALGTIAVVETLAGEFDSAERCYAESFRIMRDDGVLNSDAALDVISEYARALRKVHRRRDARAVEAQLKALRGPS